MCLLGKILSNILYNILAFIYNPKWTIRVVGFRSEGWGQGWHLEGVDVGDIGEVYREIQARYREVYLEGVDVGDDEGLRGAAAARAL